MRNFSVSAFVKKKNLKAFLLGFVIKIGTTHFVKRSTLIQSKNRLKIGSILFKRTRKLKELE